MRHVGSLALFVFGAALLGTAACEGGSPEPASSDSGAPDTGVFDDATDTTPDTVAEDGAADTVDAPPAEIPIDPKVLAAIPGKDAIAGTHWRPVGGPKTFPEAEAALAALGDDLYLSTVRGLRKTTGTGWIDVAPRACRFAPSANGALLCVAEDGATFDRFDGTTWTTHVCPGGGCTIYGSLIETGTGTMLYAPFGGGTLQRRAAGSTTWTDVAGFPGACLGGSAPVSASGARVVVGRCRSFDDGLSFVFLPDVTQAVATSAGILASGPSSVSLHTPTAVLTTLSSSASLAAGDTRVTAWTSAGTLQVSIDGGATWTARASSKAPQYVSRGVLAYPLGGKFNPRIDEVQISTDDGVSFKSVSIPRGTNAFGGAYRASTKELFTADIEPTIYTADALRLHRSTDGGTTWTAVAFPYHWRRAEGGYGGDFDLLLQASPGGQVFAGSYNSFTHFDDTTGAFVEEPAMADRSMSAAAGKLFLPSTRRFSTDDGKTWSAVVDKGWNRPGGLDAAGVAWGRKETYDADWSTTIERSTDGITWLATGFLEGRLLGVTSDRTLLGWAGSPRVLHRSTDRGVSWSTLTVSASEYATTLLPLGGSSTLVLVVGAAKSFTVQMSNDGGVTFVDRTLDLPGRPDSFFAGNAHVWATVPDYGMFELVGP